MLMIILVMIPAFANKNAFDFLHRIQTNTIVADPADVKSVDAIIAALYDVISGGAGQPSNWNRMRSLFLSEGKLLATGQQPTGENQRKTK